MEEHQVSWYAIKVFFNKTFQVEKLLVSEGLETYVPCTQSIIRTKTGTRTIRKPLIFGLLFVRTTADHCRRLSQDFWGQLSVYARRGEPLWTPAPIDERQFNVFRLVTSSGEQGLDYFEDDPVKFSKGQPVRVTGGPFEGAEGRIVRIKGNHRLVVQIDGVCAVATAYIPQCFLERVGEN